MPAQQRPTGGSSTAARPWSTTRRAVLAAALAAPVLTSGCGLRLGQPPRAATPTGPTPDERARERAAAAAEDLAARAVAAARVVRGAAPQLEQIAAEHRAHADALRPPRATTRPSTSPAPSSATPTGTASAPAGGQAALAALLAAERAEVTAIEHDLPQVSGEVARLLASVAGCLAADVEVVAQLARRGSAR